MRITIGDLLRRSSVESGRESFTRLPPGAPAERALTVAPPFVEKGDRRHHLSQPLRHSPATCVAALTAGLACPLGTG